MAKNQRRRAQEALFPPAPSTIPPEEEKAAERTETPEKPIPGIVADKVFGPGFYDPKPGEQHSDEKLNLTPEELIVRQYDIAPNCTNVPRLLYALLCETVRRRV